MGLDERVHVVNRRIVGLGGVQHGACTPLPLAVLVGLHDEFEDAGRLHRGDGVYRRLVLEQHHPLEPDVADLRGVAERGACRGQCHLAVGGAGQRGHVVDLVVGQPRQCRGPDRGLPSVPFGLLEQAHMRAQQRVRGHQMRAAGLLVGIRGQHQAAVRPGRQRRVDQLAGRKQHGEVHLGARGVQVAQELTQPVRNFLAAPHSGQCRHRDVQCGGGLINRSSQKRMRRQLAENPEAILEGGLHGCRETHGVPEVFDPVVGITVGLLARVERGRRVVRDLRRHRGDVGQHLRELVEDWLDLGRMRRHIDVHFAGHDLALFPRRHDVADGLSGATDHGRVRRRHDGDHDILDALLLEFLADLMSGQLHRRHRAAAGQAQA